VGPGAGAAGGVPYGAGDGAQQAGAHGWQQAGAGAQAAAGVQWCWHHEQHPASVPTIMRASPPA
jgi:hypothetical protein